ncbi:MAG: sulfurtransferase TusA family protein [SAR86 cluster bacterium]|jgi:tRNA 2-thiouridine synthesizing protein A|nr:sulfurtransferase TusA family protein [SAR86 cluster bacterium]|tara:strand:- start:6382 stop:6609 length:228 start_codon:yes stop_codon:yes gene_type:complete
MKNATILDLTGLECPLPLLKTKVALNSLESGDILEVTTSDPTSWDDFTVFTKISGNLLVEANKLEDKYLFKIKKS